MTKPSPTDSEPLSPASGNSEIVELVSQLSRHIAIVRSYPPLPNGATWKLVVYCQSEHDINLLKAYSPYSWHQHIASWHVI